MAAFTSKATGNWSSGGQTTWNEVGVPGNGDTVTIGTGHAITVDVDTTIGTSPAAGAGTAAVLVNATGTLTVAAGKRFTQRGDVKLNNTTLTFGAGAIHEFDASLAGVPSTALYVCQIGTNATDPNAKVIYNGTAGSRCTIRSVNTNGGANGRFTSNGNDQSGQVDATFVDLLRIGDATHTAFEFWLRSGQMFRVQNMTADACGALTADNGGGLDADCQVTFNHVTMKNTVGPNCGSTTMTSSAKTGGGIRSMTFCAWDLGFLFHAATDWTIDDNIFQGTPDWTTGAAASLNRNAYLIPEANGGDWAVFGPITDGYVLRIGNPSNQHGLTTTAASSLFKGIVFDAPDMTDNAGDCITIAVDPGVPQTLTLREDIVLPCGVGAGGVGTLLSNLVNANVSWSAEHCTYQGSQGIYFELPGFAGQSTSIKSNLAFAFDSSPATALIISGEPGTTTDVVASGNVTNNGKWNPASIDGYSDNLTFSSGTPGLNDVSGNPSFVDAGVNLKTWDANLGGPGTVAHAIAELVKLNDGSGYNPKYNCLALLAYLRAGMRPRNASTFKAAHDNIAPTLGWIGAVQGVDIPVAGGENGPGFMTGSPYSFTGEMATGAVEFVPGQDPENGPGFVTGSPYSFTGEAMTGGPEFVPGQQFGPGFVTGSALSFTGEMATGVSDATAASPNTVSAVVATHSYVGQTPQVRVKVSPAQVTHTYTAQTPQVRTKVQPAQVTHTYVGRAPALPTRVTVPARAHTYVGQTPQLRTKVQPAQATHTYVAQTPQARVKVQPAQATHTYTARVPQVRMPVAPPQATHTYLGKVPTLPVSNAVSPAQVTHTYVGRSPKLQSSVQPPSRAHSYTGQAPQLRTKVQPGQVTHTYTARTPQARIDVRPAPATHTYVGRAPQAKGRIQPGPATHTYLGRAPATAAGNIVFAPAIAHLYAAIAPTQLAAIVPVYGSQARPQFGGADPRPAQVGDGARPGQSDTGRRRN